MENSEESAQKITVNEKRTTRIIIFFIKFVTNLHILKFILM